MQRIRAHREPAAASGGRRRSGVITPAFPPFNRNPIPPMAAPRLRHASPTSGASRHGVK